MALPLLAELTAAGIRLTREGADLRVAIRPGAAVEPFRDEIARHRAALLVVLRTPDDPLDLPDVDILRSEALHWSQREVDDRIARLEARANAAGATDRDRQLLRIWLAIAAEQDRPASSPTPQPIPASALPDPWNLQGRGIA
jgi:hypothetical protein